MKHGETDPDRTAKEIMDGPTAALTIADHYGMVEALSARIERSMDISASEGILTADEVGAPD